VYYASARADYGVIARIRYVLRADYGVIGRVHYEPNAEMRSASRALRVLLDVIRGRLSGTVAFVRNIFTGRWLRNGYGFVCIGPGPSNTRLPRKRYDGHQKRIGDSGGDDDKTPTTVAFHLKRTCTSRGRSTASAT